MKTLMMTLVAGAALLLASGADARGPEFDRDGLRAFCEGARPVAQKGVQPDGNKADSSVLRFLFGQYFLGDARKEIYLQLYSDGSYYLLLAKQSLMTYGTAGDDTVNGRMIGGCSREQLSEVLRKNDLLDKAKSIVPEDSSLREAAD